jgi:iron complex outermembrane receptor protein
MKIFNTATLLFLFLLFLTGHLNAQTLTGTVYDETDTPMPGVQVHVPSIHKGATTDVNGSFTLTNLPQGIYTVQFSFLGYRTETRQINFSKAAEPLRIILEQTALELPGITVTSSPQPTDVLSTSQSVASLDEEQLFRNQGNAIMETLGDVPGVSTYTTGNGIAKPVIRGLSSQRVLVVVNGVRQEGQQWGDEHSPEIDPYSAERIEVVKGPSSVLYGSDALGGVVNVIKPDLPTTENDPIVNGNINVSGYSNNNLLGGALSLSGAQGSVGYRGSFTKRNSGNIETARRTLENTGMEETNGSLMLGTVQQWGEFALDYSRVDQRLEIFENPAEEPGATPYQTVVHDRLQSDLDLHLSGFRLEAQTAYQNNNRKEFVESDAPRPELNLVLKTGTTDIKLHHKPVGNLFGTFGISGMAQRNQTLAEEKLIPEFVLYNVAGFIYEELKLDSFNISAGLRFDRRIMNIGATPELNVEKQEKKYNAFSGNVGGVWRISDPFALSVNLGRAWRAPTAFELYVDGVHEGTARFETGDSTMEPESSFNIDASAKYISGNFQSELSAYNNRINNYIFPNPTNEFDPGSGFRKYQYTQANARIYGLEYSLQAQAFSWLILSGGYSIVRGTNQRINDPLPLMPADQLKLGVKFTKPKLGVFYEPYFTIDTQIFAKQDRIAGFETPTNGYTLVDLSIGSKFQAGSQKLNILLQAENIFSKAYRSHLSRYKEYALNPGRNIKLKINIPFTLID